MDLLRPRRPPHPGRATPSAVKSSEEWLPMPRSVVESLLERQPLTTCARRRRPAAQLGRDDRRRARPRWLAPPRRRSAGALPSPPSSRAQLRSQASDAARARGHVAQLATVRVVERHGASSRDSARRATSRSSSTSAAWRAKHRHDVATARRRTAAASTRGARDCAGSPGLSFVSSCSGHEGRRGDEVVQVASAHVAQGLRRVAHHRRQAVDARRRASC